MTSTTCLFADGIEVFFSTSLMAAFSSGRSAYMRLSRAFSAFSVGVPVSHIDAGDAGSNLEVPHSALEDPSRRPCIDGALVSNPFIRLIANEDCLEVHSRSHPIDASQEALELG